MKKYLGLGILALVLVAGGVLAFIYTRPTPPPPPPDSADDGPAWFVDVTDEVGINFVHDAGPAGTYFMPQQVGSGAAFFDFDGDNLLDIYLLQNGGPDGPRNVLYKQTA